MSEGTSIEDRKKKQQPNLYVHVSYFKVSTPFILLFGYIFQIHLKYHT